MANIVGRVAVLEGHAVARAQDGSQRPLKVGDAVYEGEVIVSGPHGHVELAFDNGHSFTLPAKETVTLDASVVGTNLPETHDAALISSAEQTDRIAQAIAQGSSLDDLLDETAAGLTGGGDGNNGHSFVQLLRIVEGVSPSAYQFNAEHGPVAQEMASGAGVPDAQGPTAVSDTATTREDEALSGNVLANDLSPGGSPLHVTGFSVDTNGDGVPESFAPGQTATIAGVGDVTMGANGGYSFVPVTGYSGPVPVVSYGEANDRGDTASGTLNINVVADIPPVAHADTASTTINVNVVVPVLANDTDADGDQLLLTALTNGAHGTVGIDLTSGNPVYIPATDWVGTDTFTYTVSDGHGGTATASVTVTVGVMAAPTVTITTDANNDGYINKAEQGGATGEAVTIGLPAAARAGDVLTISDGSATQAHTLTKDDIAAGSYGTTVAEPAEGATLTVTATITDSVGNPSLPGTDSAVLDAQAPSVIVDIAATALNAGQTSPVTFTFSEAPVGFTAADITATGGSVSGLTATANPLVWTATFTPTAGYTGSANVAVANASYTDAAGNAGGGNTDTAAIDTQAPSVLVDIQATALNAGQTSPVTFTFSEAPVGFTAADVTATGGSVSGLTATANPLVWTATFTPTAGYTGPASVSVANASYTDAAGNAGTGNSDTAAIDTQVPSVIVDIAAANLNASQTSPVTFTFSEAPTGFTAADVSASGGTVTGLTATANPLVWTATFTPTPGYTGTASVAVTNGSYTDSLGNAGTGNSDTAAIDTQAPSVLVDIQATALNAGQTSPVTFTFSEAPVGFTAADVTATGGSVSGLTATANPLVWTATFTPTAGYTGSANVAVANASYTDAAGNAGTGNNDTAAIDTQAPSVLVDIAAANLNAGQTSPVTFTFSEAPTGFTAADITAAGGAVSGLTATANPLVWTATFTPTAGYTGTATVAVTNASYTDAAGNAGTGNSDTAAIDTQAPSVIVDIAAANLNAGQTSPVTFTFSEAPTGFTAADVTASGGAVSGLAATANPLVWTATFTPTAGYTGTATVAVTNASYTDAAGNAGTGNGDTAAIDAQAPSVIVDIAATALNAGQTSPVTFTFSEAPTGFTAADITAVGGAVSGLTATANPLVWTATFTPTAGYTGPASVSVANASYTDAAGNAGSGNTDTAAIDTQAPSVIVDIAATALNAGQTSPVTFTFSEAPTGFTAADITAAGGAVSGLTATANPLVWTATFTPTAGYTGPASVSVANASYTDAAGNAGTGNSDTAAIDTQAPSVLVDIQATNLNASQTSPVTFTFSEAPTGFTAADITATGGSVSGLTATANPLVWTATFTPTAGYTGSANVAVANASYTDAAGNAGSGNTDTAAIDTQAPSVLVDIQATALNAGQTSPVTFTFSEAPVGFTAADVTATGGSVSGLTATANPLVWTATFTPTAGYTGTATVAVANASYTDAAGNAGTGNSDTAAIDTQVPSVIVNIAAANLNASQTSPVTFTFSEAPTGFTAADVSASGGTVTGLTATANPLVWTATFTPTPGYTGTASVAVTNGSYTDSLGNAGTGNSDTAAIDTQAPSVLVDIQATALNAGQTSPVTFTFSEAPVGFTAADVTATGGSVSGLTATANPLVWTATFTPTAGYTGSANVAVANASYTDAAGNAGTGNSDTAAIDTQAPSVIVDIAATALNAGQTSPVTFTFSEAPVGFTAADVTATGGSVSGLTATANPLVWTATFTPTAGYTGTATVAVANASYTDAAGNAGTGNSDTAAIDTQAPSVIVDIAAANLNASQTSPVTFTFSEAPTGFTAADVSASGGTVTGLTATANPLVWTATFTPTPGYTGTASVAVTNGSYTDSLGNAGTGNSDTAAIDTQAPSVLVDIQATNLNASQTSPVTFTFSEAPTGFTAADITTSGGTVSGLTATANPLVWTATFTPTAGYTGPANVAVANASYTDAAGNAGTGNSDSAAIDTQAPSVLVDIQATALNAGQTSPVTFTFSEAPVGFTAADVTAAGGSVSGLAATANPLVYTATFTPTAGYTGSANVAVANASYTDAAGNAGSGNTDTAAIDTQAPSVIVDIAATALNAGQTSPVTFTFSEAPTGFIAADVSASGGTVTGLTATANPLVWTATFTPTAGYTGPANVAVANASYTDAAGNAGTGNSDSAAIDTQAPSVLVDIQATALNAGQTSPVTFTFSEAPVGFTAADVTATGGSVSGLTATANPLVYTATFTPTAGYTGSANVAVANASYTDAAGNAGSGNTDTAAIDTQAPSVIVDIAATALNAGQTSPVTFTFSEAPTGFTAADITAAGGAVSGLTATANPLVWTATFTPTAGYTGPASVSVANASYTDAAGNAGTGNTDTAAIDTQAPSVIVDIAATALNAGQTSPVTFTFSEAPVGFTAADVTAAGGSVSGLTATANPLVWTATFTPTAGYTGSANVAVANASYADAAGNAGTGNSDSAAIDAQAPSVLVDIQATALNAGQTSPVTFTFSEAPVGFTAADVTATGGSVSGLTATANPLVYTATFTPTAGYTGSANVAVANASYTDAAGNAGTGNSDTAAIDTQAPSTPGLSASTTVGSISGLFNTGVDASGNAIATGATDSHYTLISHPAGATFSSSVAVSQSAASNVYWSTTDYAHSEWIGSTASNPATGTFEYQTSFVLSGSVDLKSVDVQFDINADDNVAILVNGVNTGIALTSLWQAGSVQHVDLSGASSLFVLGTNTITFDITNTGSGPTGLKIDNMTATALTSDVMPVTVSLAGSGAHANDILTFTTNDGTSTTTSYHTLTAAEATGSVVESATVPTGNSVSTYTATLTDVAGNVSPLATETVFGSGNHTVTAALGADVFKWTLDSHGAAGTPAIDAIKSFSTSNSDVLDLRDLLVGENHASGIGNLDHYINITTSTSGGVTSTEIRVSHAGGFANGTYNAGAEDQHITLTGVNLFATYGDSTNAQLIQHLLNNNKLVTD